MSIKRLLLKNYRNYENFDLKIKEMCVVLCGKNGVGKTNILEAISLLSSTRGIRGDEFSKMQNICIDDHSPWTIFAEISSTDRDFRIGIERASNGRNIKINGKAAKAEDCFKIIKIISFTPGVDKIFSDQSLIRRRFFNILIANFDDNYATNLILYDKYLKERMKILMLIKEEIFSKNKYEYDKSYIATSSFSDQDNSYENKLDIDKKYLWLDVIEENIAKLSIDIELCRLNFWQKFNKIQSMNNFPSVKINIISNVVEYLKINLKWCEEDQLDEGKALQLIKDELKKCRKRDMIIKRNTFGAHRSDVSGFAYDKNAEMCSTGQQKMIVISMLFSIARLYLMEGKINLIMLLDELTAHVDSFHGQIIFQEIENLIQDGVQFFITGTDVSCLKFDDRLNSVIKMVDF